MGLSDKPETVGKMREPKDAFELIVWERLYGAILASGLAASKEEAAEEADAAFEQYGKRRDALLAKLESK